MTTSSASALGTLIELATVETDDAAKRLGQANQAHQEAAEKLTLLTQYRDDYTARFQAGSANGLTADGYRNFQSFIGKLDGAIAGQQEVVREMQRRIDDARGRWQASERKRRSYGTLANRAQQREQVRDAKRDQKQMDEHAARQMYYKT